MILPPSVEVDSNSLLINFCADSPAKPQYSGRAVSATVGPHQLPFGEEASEPAVAPKSGRVAYVRGRETVAIWRADLTAAVRDIGCRRIGKQTRQIDARQQEVRVARSSAKSRRKNIEKQGCRCHGDRRVQCRETQRLPQGANNRRRLAAEQRTD